MYHLKKHFWKNLTYCRVLTAYPALFYGYVSDAHGKGDVEQLYPYYEAFSQCVIEHAKNGLTFCLTFV